MRSFKDLSQIKTDNITLSLTKLVKREVIENSKGKKDFLNNIKNIPINNTILTNSLKSLVSELKKQNYKIIYNNSLFTTSPLICGLGATSVLETSITLHHIWGVPYIPASSLKGVCRQVAFWEMAEKRQAIEKKDLAALQEKFYGNLNFEDEEMLKYQLLFGAQDFKGLLLFLDAYPDLSKNNNPFRLDIMNPHYSSYYGDDTGETPPGDWDNPVPIYFLTVKEGVSFHFTVMFDNYRWTKIKEKEFEADKEKKKIPEDAKKDIDKLKEENSKEFFKEILKKALDSYGIGSKTRLGYGSF